MPYKIHKSKIIKVLFILVYLSTLYLPLFSKLEISPIVEKSTAGNFQMQTGGYVGNGNVQSISGLGFTPDLVIIRPAADTGVGTLFKTSTMVGNTFEIFVATNTRVGFMTLDIDGFTVMSDAGATPAGNTNGSNIYYTWIAFGGSDCSATGNFCVGTYLGSGSSPRLITTGFQPDLVWVKAAGVTAANWKSSSMPTNYSQYFTNTAQNTTGTLFTTLSSTGFNVGTGNNSSSTPYYFVAFKNTTNIVAVGSYTGNGTSQNVNVGFVPEFVFVKSATNSGGSHKSTETYGNSACGFIKAVCVTNAITGFISSPVSGFSVGNSSSGNASTATIYYAAFAGASNTRNSSGTFKMAKGTYTGTGATGDYINIDNLEFAPDLVIVKGDTTQATVFRTSDMAGDYTAFFVNNSSITGGIVSLNPNGFTIGNSEVVNTSGATYYWEAFGNAWRENTNSGASDFYVGSYFSGTTDDTNIKKLPFQADMVVVRSRAGVSGVFRTSSHSGDLTSFYGFGVEASDLIQTLNSDGFQIGTAAEVNTSLTINYYFGFKTGGGNFAVGSYNGNGSTQDISVGFQLDYIWVKHPSATAGIERSSDLSGDGVLPFIALGKATSSITAINATTFSLSSSSYVNQSSTNNYRFVAWKTNSTPTSPSYQMQTGGYTGTGEKLKISGLGFSPDLVIIKSATTGGIGTLFKTSAMIDNADPAFINVADSLGAITLDPDGFSVMGANSNTINIYHTWIAFGGSDCSSNGKFCVGAYVGTGSSPRSVTSVGFQPNLVWVKPSGANAATWKSSTMPTDYAQHFIASAQSTNGAYFTTLDSTGFSVGASNNTTSGIFYYVAFKSTAGVISVGSYTGNGTSQNVDVGYVPDFVFVKNSASTGSALYQNTESYGGNSYYYTDTAVLTNGLTGLISTPVEGFSVGSDSRANGSSATMYYSAFGGASDTRSSSGTFKMAKGTYIGTGSSGSYVKIADLDFAPDLVIIKGNTTQGGVFTTSNMPRDYTAYFSSGTNNFTGGIVSIEPDGFTVGPGNVVNTLDATYYWEAFGNAWDANTNSGATDFYVGSYLGSTIDNIDIKKLPFQANMVAIKSNSTQTAAFRTSSHSGDLSSLFNNTAEAADLIQVLNSDGFQIGTSVIVNPSIIINNYFGFKSGGGNFAVGSYNGNGSTQDITVGFQADYIWVKHPTTTAGVSRSSDFSGDGVLPFTSDANVTSSITAINSTTFSLSSSSYVNQASTNNYRYVAWRIPVATVISITVTDGEVSFGFMPLESSKTTITLSDTQTVTNNGNVTVTVSVKGFDTGCPWTLASTVANEQYMYEFSINDGSNWYPISKTYGNLKTGLTASSSQEFDLKFWTPSSTLCNNEQTANITLLATQE